MEKHLHIITLNVPYPADYGGVYDLFYKLPALQQEGVKIHLHCFYKDRTEQPELNKYCEEVFYYKRDMGAKKLFTNLPYIVASRRNEELMQRLLKDDYPIFMEGVHCTFITNDERFANRKKFVRIHNVENEYYKNLVKHSDKLRNKIYYLFEAKQLARYEKSLARNATAYWAVSLKDTEYYRKQLDCRTMDYLPLFLPDWKVQIEEGFGSYSLYHGDLSVEENEFAVKWLFKHVFSKLEMPVVVAGKNPSKKLIAFVEANKYAYVVANPDESQMQDIIAKAHIHVLPAFNTTGVKIKLLNALYNGRHCVVNDEMIDGTPLNDLCHIVNTPGEFAERISMLYHQPFTEKEIELRKQQLTKEFSNQANAKQMVKWIWNVYA